MFTKTWGFDEALIDAIAHHHEPQKNSVLKDCVSTANQISKKMQFGFAGNPVVDEFPGEVIRRFELTLDDLINTLGDLSHVRLDALSFIHS